MTRCSGTVIIVSIAVVLMLATLYYSMGPESGIYPRCVFKQFTGYSCPGCGSQRALHAMLHGNFTEAWQYNVILPFMLLIVALTGVAGMYRSRYARLHRVLNSHMMILLVIAITIGWTIIRNLFNI